MTREPYRRAILGDLLWRLKRAVECLLTATPARWR